MHMGKLTEMERLAIEEQLWSEDICSRKVQLYMSITRDPAVQAILQQIAEKGQRHCSILNGMLQEAGIVSGLTQTLKEEGSYNAIQ